MFDVVTHIAELLHQTQQGAVIVTLGCLAIIYGLPRLTAKVPPQLAAVFVATVAVALLPLEAATIGSIPRSLPSPRLPELPREIGVVSLLGSTLVVYALASLETLLSSTAVDKLSSGPRSDPDQELIGQGLGNVASALFGGIPVTGVIARSAVNVQAGAKTRRSAIVHGIMLLLVVLIAAPFIGKIPIAALAAVLFSVALRMLNPRHFMRLWRHSRADGAVFAVTFVVIVFVGLLEGVQWGVVAALVVAAIQLGRTRPSCGARGRANTTCSRSKGRSPSCRLSNREFAARARFARSGRGVVINLRGVSIMDATGADLLTSTVEHARAHQLRPVLLGLTEDQREKLVASAAGGDVRSVLVGSRGEAGLIWARAHRPISGYARASTATAARFGRRTRISSSNSPRGKRPHLIHYRAPIAGSTPTSSRAPIPASSSSCATSALWSRLHRPRAPQSGPRSTTPSVSSRCARSSCAGIRDAARSRPSWPKEAGRNRSPTSRHGSSVPACAACSALPAALAPDEVARLVALAQLDRLRSYGVVQDATLEEHLSLAAWFFDIGSGELEEWSPEDQRYLPVEVDRTPAPHHPEDARG